MSTIYRITADDKALEGVYRYKPEAEKFLRDSKYEDEGEGDWSKASWTDSGEAIIVIYARIEEEELL